MTFYEGQRVRCVDAREPRYDHTGKVIEVGMLGVYVRYQPATLPDGGKLPDEVAHRADQLEPIGMEYSHG